MIVRQDSDGEVLEQVRIDNDPVALACAIENAGPNPEVVLEATYGWYWAADLLLVNRLPEAWVAPPATRELRELVRHRAKLVAWRSGLKAQVHAVLAKQGVAVPMSDLFGKAGMELLAGAPLDRTYRLRVSSLLDADAKLRADRDRIIDRRGKGISKVAAARRLALVLYGLRDGHILA